MRNILLGAVLFLMATLSVAIICVAGGRNIRSTETTESLEESVESAMNVLNKNTYTIQNTNEFISDFTEMLLLRIESDSEITVNILDVDYEKGILSVEVVENFTHINGKSGTVSCTRTVVLEQTETNPSQEAEENRKFTVRYLVPGENEPVTPVSYKEYSIKNGDPVIIPPDPDNIGEKRFVCWNLNGAEFDFHNNDGSFYTVTGNIELQAKYE